MFRPTTERQPNLADPRGLDEDPRVRKHREPVIAVVVDDESVFAIEAHPENPFDLARPLPFSPERSEKFSSGVEFLDAIVARVENEEIPPRVESDIDRLGEEIRAVDVAADLEVDDEPAGAVLVDGGQGLATNRSGADGEEHERAGRKTKSGQTEPAAESPSHGTSDSAQIQVAEISCFHITPVVA